MLGMGGAVSFAGGSSHDRHGGADDRGSSTTSARATAMSHRPSPTPSPDHGARRAAAASRATPLSTPFGERIERAPTPPTPVPTSSAAVSQADGDA